MRLIKPSFFFFLFFFFFFSIWDQQEGLEGVYKQIAKEFVDRMIKSGHGAMLEHGTVYLKKKNSLWNYG